MTNTVYTFTLEVCDQPGVLVRAAQVFSRRGCNITSIHVEHPADTAWSHMHITAKNVARVDQIISQLEKLVDIHSVTLHTKQKVGEP